MFCWGGGRRAGEVVRGRSYPSSVKTETVQTEVTSGAAGCGGRDSALDHMLETPA